MFKCHHPTQYHYIAHGFCVYCVLNCSHHSTECQMVRLAHLENNHDYYNGDGMLSFQGQVKKFCCLFKKRKFDIPRIRRTVHTIPKWFILTGPHNLKQERNYGKIHDICCCRRQCKIFTSGVNFSRNNAIYDIDESPKYILSCPWKTLVNFKVWNLWATHTHCLPWARKIWNNLILGPSEHFYFGQ